MMKKTVATLVTLFGLGAVAHAEPPTEASVVELLELTRAEALIEQSTARVETMIRQGMQRQAAGRTLSDEQQRVLDAAPARLVAAFSSEFSWTKLQPIFVAIYQESLEQSDVDGLIAFYRTPAGQAFIAKMPAIMQRSMDVTQTQLQAVLPKLKQAMQEVAREAKLPPKS